MALSISSLTFDKATYNSGDPVTLTVDYVSDDASTAADVTSNVTVTVSDSENTATGTQPFSVAGAASMLPASVSATDDRSPAGTWTLVSNAVTGSNPWNGTAVLTSVA